MIFQRFSFIHCNWGGGDHSWNLLQIETIDLKCSKQSVGKSDKCELISPAINLVFVKSVAWLDWWKQRGAAKRVMT